MKQAALCFVAALLMILQESCVIGKRAFGEPGKCEVHGLSLHKSLVRVKYGAYCAPGTHLGAGSEAFPNAKHPVCGGCSVREPFRYLYNCSECNRQKRSLIFGTKKRKENLVKTKF